VKVKDYFKFMDTLVQRLDKEVAYELNEYILLRTNKKLLDSLMGTDYYLRKARGEFVYNQKQLAVLHRGDTILIPGDSLAARVNRQIAATWFDINIPEFRLRIVEGSDTLYTLPVRVGQNRQRFLETIGREEILRTKTGVGKIIRVNRYPVWTNPVDGEEYKDTKRDDGRRTKLPQIPWIEPEINGARYGQMIHPTTNPETLNKAYSNGCIGASEADSWLIYAMAPIGTSVVIRYDRMKITAQGDTVWLRHIYDKKKMKKD
jgi:L,D-transpeptidase ErfK/SrfK